MNSLFVIKYVCSSYICTVHGTESLWVNVAFIQIRIKTFLVFNPIYFSGNVFSWIKEISQYKKISSTPIWSTMESVLHIVCTVPFNRVRTAVYCTRARVSLMYQLLQFQFRLLIQIQIDSDTKNPKLYFSVF